MIIDPYHYSYHHHYHFNYHYIIVITVSYDRLVTIMFDLDDSTLLPSYPMKIPWKSHENPMKIPWNHHKIRKISSPGVRFPSYPSLPACWSHQELLPGPAAATRRDAAGDVTPCLPGGQQNWLKIDICISCISLHAYVCTYIHIHIHIHIIINISYIYIYIDR